MYFYLGYINIIYENLAGIHIVETADKVYYCCFAGTVRSDQAIELTFPYIHIKFGYGTQSSE